MSAGEIADRIEREILIDAPIERVWQLVPIAGWEMQLGFAQRDTECASV
jgi:hypothetical protein